MNPVTLDVQLAKIFIKQGFHVSSYNTIDANKEVVSCHPMARIYYLRICGGEIDIGNIKTFDRWSNSTDFIFLVKNLLTNGQIDLDKIELFYLLLDYTNTHFQPTWTWLSECIDLSDYWRKVKRHKKRIEYIDGLKKKRRHLRKHLLK